MTTTITYQGGNTISPHLALIGSHERESESRNVQHEILGGPPVYTLRTANPPRGTLMLLFKGEQEALDAYVAHELPAPFTITDTDRAALNFQYIVNGSLRMRLDRDTAALWVVEVQYQVTA